MRRLNRYILENTLKILFLCELFGIVIFLMVDFFEHIDLFARSLEALSLSVSYLLFRVPFYANLLLPLSFLTSMLILFVIMARNNEILSLRSLGISTLSIMKPLVFLSLFLTSLNFLISEYVSPHSLRVSEEILRIRIKKEEPYLSVKNDRIWLKKENLITRIEYFDPHTDSLAGVTLIELSKDYSRILRRIDAKEGAFTGGEWVFRDVSERRFDEEMRMVKSFYPTLSGLLSENPKVFKSVSKNPDQMSFNELSNYITRLRNQGHNVRRYIVDLQSKISFPFVNLIMVILATSIGLRYKSVSHVSRGIFLGLLLGFLYWVINSFSLSLGYSEIFPPLFSAWFANFVFFSGGMVGILSLRT